eukprot:6214661-Pleurochrysis_carterae.AAC.7
MTKCSPSQLLDSAREVHSFISSQMAGTLCKGAEHALEPIISLSFVLLRREQKDQKRIGFTTQESNIAKNQGYNQKGNTDYQELCIRRWKTLRIRAFVWDQKLIHDINHSPSLLLGSARRVNSFIFSQKIWPFHMSAARTPRAQSLSSE